MGGIGGRSICHDLLARQFSLSQHMTNFNIVNLRYSAPVLDAGHVHAMACESHLIIHLPYCSIEGQVTVLLVQIPKFLSVIVGYFSLMVRSNIVQLSKGRRPALRCVINLPWTPPPLPILSQPLYDWSCQLVLVSSALELSHAREIR